MADFNHGNIANFTLASQDLSDWVTNVSVDLQREIKDVRPIGANPVSKVVGPYAGTISVECAYDKVLDAIIAPLFLAATPTTSTFDHEPSGSGGSNRSITGSALVASYRVDTSGSDTAGLRFTLAVVGTVTNST
jgi:hypothetical protein